MHHRERPRITHLGPMRTRSARGKIWIPDARQGKRERNMTTRCWTQRLWTCPEKQKSWALKQIAQGASNETEILDKFANFWIILEIMVITTTQGRKAFESSDTWSWTPKHYKLQCLWTIIRTKPHAWNWTVLKLSLSSSTCQSRLLNIGIDIAWGKREIHWVCIEYRP